MYLFYYDESEHSRKINYNTINADNFYDSFATVIVGWNDEYNSEIEKLYESFESKYKDRKDKNGEIKSNRLHNNEFKYGFASVNKHNTRFLNDFLEIFNEKVKIYVSFHSKIEYLVVQLFSQYDNNIFFDADSMKYSITKALVTYRPENVIKAISESPDTFVESLKMFFNERIQKNIQHNIRPLETNAFNEIITVLDSISSEVIISWDYKMTFEGFAKYLNEQGIDNYKIILDNEGNEGQDSRTCTAAKSVGLMNVEEKNSKDVFGLRMADMMVGIITKLMKHLSINLHKDYGETVELRFLDPKWFALSNEQLQLYLKMNKIICENDKAWYKSYIGLYPDDFIVFIALLKFINDEKTKQLMLNNLEILPRCFNDYSCQCISDYFKRLKVKIPIDPIPNTKKDYYYNQSGAKVYFDIKKQPLLNIEKGCNKLYKVLSTGIERNGIPVITVFENENYFCYRLPNELCGWSRYLLSLSILGNNLLPSDVLFSNVDGNYTADIL